MQVTCGHSVEMEMHYKNISSFLDSLKRVRRYILLQEMEGIKGHIFTPITASLEIQGGALLENKESDYIYTIGINGQLA